MSNETSAFIERANLLLEQGRFSDAEKFIKQALAKEPENDYALSVLARIYLNNGQHDKGIEIIQKAIGIDPEESFYYYLLGFGYYHKNLTAQAVTYLSKAIELDPYSAEYYGLLAFVQLDDQRFEEGLSKANEGLAIDAENITCLNARSVALNKLRRTDDAIETMQNALAQDPDNEFTHSTIGWNLLEKGKHKQATEHFREALRLAPDHHNAKSGLKEALKSKIPPYRWLLQFNFWLSNKGSNFRWGFLIGIFVIVRIIATVSNDSPGFENVGMVVAGAYLLFVSLSWILNPLANSFLFFHRDGKHALEKQEKTNAIGFMTCIAAGTVILFLSSFAGEGERANAWLASGLITLSLSIPTGHMLFPVRFKNNTVSQWIAIGLLFSGIISLLVGLTGIFPGEVLFICYFFLFIIYTWATAF
jgi:tetratricopeptide (TPR) repeat protein